MDTHDPNLYEIYQRRRDELLDLVGRQVQLIAELGMDEAQAQGLKHGEVLAGLIGALESDKLRVLVVGRFSAGKSTFINALFGQVVLPASPTPTTGVLCVIRYAEEHDKRAVLYPKPGMGPNGSSEPIPIFVENLQAELNKFVRIQHSGDDQATSRYEKLELFWPLELCKNGVELIDSVGLDDPEARDEITLQYAQTSDAILYCMKSQDAYSGKDKQVLSLLESLGYRSILFIITHYDHIRVSARRGEMSEHEFRSLLEVNLKGWTELGVEGIKYVDSRAALDGRLDHHEKMVNSSLIFEVEAALAEFLTQEKGRAKLLKALRSLGMANRATSRVVPARVAMWRSSAQDLERRYREAEVPLRQLETSRQLMISKMSVAIKDASHASRDLCEAFLIEFPDRMRVWASAYEIHGSIGIPRKSTIEPVVKEVVEHLKGKVQEEFGEWSAKTLTPMIERRVEEMRGSIEGAARDFLKNVDELRLKISLGDDALNAEEISRIEKPSVWGRLAAGGFAVLTHDYLTGGIGMVLGIRAMVTSIALQVVAAVVLLIFGVTNPIGWIVTFLLASVGGGTLNALSLRGKIKFTAADKFAEEFRKQQRTISANIASKVEESLSRLKDDLDAGFAGEIASVRGEVEAVLMRQRAGNAEAEREISQLRAIEEANVRIEERIDTLLEEAGIDRGR